MKRIILIITIVFITNYQLLAQVASLNNDQINEHVKGGIALNYHPDSIALQQLCRQACIFVKFKVNKSGFISDLSFNKEAKDSTAFIVEALSKAINLLQKDKLLIQTLKKSGKTIILPFVYDYTGGCQLPVYDYKTINDQDAMAYAIKLVKAFVNREHTQATLTEMLNFNDVNVSAIDCLLLKPFTHWYNGLSY